MHQEEQPLQNQRKASSQSPEMEHLDRPESNGLRGPSCRPNLERIFRTTKIAWQ